MEDIRLTESPLDVNAACAFVTEPGTGATSIFVGTTRYQLTQGMDIDCFLRQLGPSTGTPPSLAGVQLIRN